MRPRIAIGARLWDRLSPSRRPAELHEFPPIVGRAHTAPSTPGGPSGRTCASSSSASSSMRWATP